MPLWATAGGSGPGAAGAVTGVFMAATVAAQLGVPRLLSAVGHRAALVVGCLALGLPAALLPLSASWTPLVAVAVVRGVGFGIVTVTGAALVADLVPVAVRGRATGVYGVAVGVPQLVLLPGGVSLWSTLGPTTVLLGGAVLPLLAIPVLRLLPRRVGTADGGAPPASGPEIGVRQVGVRQVGVRQVGVRQVGVRRGLGPWTVMVVCAAGAGGVITVLPLTGTATLAALALLALTAAQLAGRSVAGEVVDRSARPGRVTPVALVAVAAGAGLVALGVGPDPATLLVVGGAGLVGAGFGAVQNDTLVTLFARAGAGRTGTASSVWNTAYDSGTGVGATVFAAILGLGGPLIAFTVAGAACACALPVALVSARRR